MQRQLSLACAALSLLLTGRALAATNYRLSIDPVDKRELTIEVRRPDADAGTTLIFHGAHVGTGVQSQIEDVECDGRPLTQHPKLDRWLVPPGCKTVQWRVRLASPNGDDSTSQRSIASADNSFRLFSGASSLATLADADQHATLSVPRIMEGVTIPKPRTDGTVALPSAGEPPLLLLLGSRPVATKVSAKLTVRYFIDDRSQKANVAPLESEARGLDWLAREMPTLQHVDLDYAWLGLPASSLSMGGATGTGLMVVNYARGGTNDDVRIAVTALAPLIEATHHLAQAFGSRNGWAEESLATYFGLQALLRARPQDGAAHELMSKFISDSEHFPSGLIQAQHRVSAGDKAAYPTYFTKGVAFWAAVDAAIRSVDPTGLEGRSKVLWTMRFDPDGEPPADFASRLGLSQGRWTDLRRRFLD